MTEISEAAKAEVVARATAAIDLELPERVNEKWEAHEIEDWAITRAFARFIQEVSDAAKAQDKALADIGNVRAGQETFQLAASVRQALAPFILPEPVDPLRAALDNIPDEDIRAISDTYDVAACRETIAQVLSRHGIEIGESGK